MCSQSLFVGIAAAGLALSAAALAAESPTYYQDVKPVVDAYCTGCHTEGGIAPFALTSYQDVAPKAGSVADAVADGRMPPWPAHHECTDYVNDRSLSQDQIRMILDWAVAGAPAGDAAHPAPPLPQADLSLSRVDLRLPMASPYTPHVHPDEYRCFVMDWSADPAHRYVTGFGVEPGHKGIVHHVIGYLIPPAQVSALLALDAADPGAGYSCFGDPGVDQAAWLGAWAPGAQSTDFPEGTGIEVAPGSKVVLQMHYHLSPHHHGSGAAASSDQSALLFRTAVQVEKVGELLPWTDPLWIDDPQTMLIPAGAADVTYSLSGDLAALRDGPVDLHAVLLHMHQIGRSGTITLQKGDETECLLNIPDWDFNWQLVYRLARPRRVEPGDQVKIECHWDNTLGNQPFVLGRRLEPRDVTWGNGSRDEMCLGLLYVTKADERAP